MQNIEIKYTVDFLFMFIAEKNYQMVAKMVNEDYPAVCKRDPEIYSKIDSISERAFGQGIAPLNPMQ